MTKRRTRRTTEEIEDELTPIEEPDRKTDFPAAFRQYLDANANLDRAFSVCLFEVNGAIGNPPDISYLCNYQGKVPAFEEIASVFGPGKYKLILHFVKKGERNTPSSASVIFTISNRYRQLDAAAVDQAASLPAPIVGYPPGAYPPDQAALLGLVKHFMTTIKDVLTARQPAQAGGIADFKAMSEAMGDIMVNSAKTQQRLVEELVLSRAGIDQEPDDDDTEPQTLTQWIVWAWREFGPAILSGTKAVQAFARQQLEQRPEYQQLTGDPALFNEAYATLVKEAGQENVDKMLAILGVVRPEGDRVSPTAGDGRDADRPPPSGQ